MAFCVIKSPLYLPNPTAKESMFHTEKEPYPRGVLNDFSLLLRTVVHLQSQMAPLLQYLLLSLSSTLTAAAAAASFSEWKSNIKRPPSFLDD